MKESPLTDKISGQRIKRVIFSNTATDNSTTERLSQPLKSSHDKFNSPQTSYLDQQAKTYNSSESLFNGYYEQHAKVREHVESHQWPQGLFFALASVRKHPHASRIRRFLEVRYRIIYGLG